MTNEIGKYIKIIRGDTIVSGVVNGWHRIEDGLITLNIEGITEPFSLDDWRIVGQNV